MAARQGIVQLLLKIRADRSQASAEVGRLAEDYEDRIRFMERTGQRVITVLSAPLRGRFGILGSIAVSAARATASYAAQQEISRAKVEKAAAAYGLTADAIEALDLSTKRHGFTLKSLVVSYIGFEQTLRRPIPAASALGKALASIPGAARLPPAAQFNALLDVLVRTTDEAERAQIASEAFGAAGLRLVKRIEQQTAVQVAAARAAASATGTINTQTSAYGANAAAASVAASAATRFAASQSGVFESPTRAATAFTGAVRSAADAASRFGRARVEPGLVGVFSDSSDEAVKLVGDIGNLTKAYNTFQAAVARSRAASDPRFTSALDSAKDAAERRRLIDERFKTRFAPAAEAAGRRGGEFLEGANRRLAEEADRGAQKVNVLRASIRSLEGQANSTRARVADFAETVKSAFGGRVDAQFLREFVRVEGQFERLRLFAERFGQTVPESFGRAFRAAANDAERLNVLFKAFPDLITDVSNDRRFAANLVQARTEADALRVVLGRINPEIVKSFEPLAKTAQQFNRLEREAGRSLDTIAGKIADAEARITRLGSTRGIRLDPAFLRSFQAAATEAERLNLLTARFGPTAAAAYAPVKNVAASFVEVERKVAESLARIDAQAARRVAVSTRTVNAFKRLGVDVEEALRKPLGSFTAFVRGVAGLNTAAERTEAVTSTLGAAGARVVSTLESARIVSTEFTETFARGNTVLGNFAANMASAAPSLQTGANAVNSISLASARLAPTFATLDRAFVDNKVGAGALAEAYDEFTFALNAAATGNAKYAAAFRRAGVDVRDAVTNQRQAFDVFLGNLAAMDASSRRNAIGARVLADAYSRLGPSLGQSNSALKAMASGSDEATAALAGVTRSAGGLAKAGAAVGLTAGPILLAVGALVAVAAAYAVATAVAIKSARSAAQYGGEIERAAERTGIAAERLAAFRLVADELGVSFDTFGLGVTRFQQRLVEAAQGNKNLSDTFSKLGFDVETAFQRPQESFEQFLVKFARLPNDAAKTAIAIQLFGESGAKMIPVLNTLGRNLEAAQKRADEFGLTLTNAEAKALKQTNIAFKDLGLAAQGIGFQIGKAAAPAVTLLIRTLTNLVVSLQPAARWLGEVLGSVVLSVTVRLIRLGAGLQTLPTFFRGVIEVGAELILTFQRLQSSASAVFTAIALGVSGNFAAAGGVIQNALVEGTEGLVNKARQVTDRVNKEFSENVRQLTSSIPNLDLDTTDEPFDPRRGEAETGVGERALASARLRVLEVEADAAQRIFQGELVAERRNFELRRTSFEQFAAAQVEASERLIARRLEVFAAERAAIAEQYQNEVARLNANFAKADTKAEENKVRAELARAQADQLIKLRQVQEREASARQEHSERVAEIEQERRVRELAAERDYADALADIQAARDTRFIETLRDGAERVAGARASAEEVVVAVERAALDRREGLLRREVELAGANVEEQAKANSALARFAEERTAFEEEAFRRIRRARLSDIESIRAHRAAIESATAATRETELRNAEEAFERLRDGVATRERFDQILIQFRATAVEEEHRINVEAITRRRETEERAAQELVQTAKETYDAQVNLQIAARRRLDAAAKETTDKELELVKATKQGEPEAVLKSIRVAIAETNRQVNEANTDLNKLFEQTDQASTALAAARLGANRVITELDRQEATEFARHTERMRSLQEERDVFPVDGSGRRRLLTRRELLGLEARLNVEAERLRHEANRRELVAERDHLLALRTLARQRARDELSAGKEAEAKASLAEAASLLERVTTANRAIEAENARHNAVVSQQSQEAAQKQRFADPTSVDSLFGERFAERFRVASESLATFEATIQATAQTAYEAFEQMSAGAGDMSTMLSGAFESMAEASGQVLETWILTGETGPAVFRKMTAQILASVARQAAVKAIYELASGFAMLFINPAEAAGHFAAAALFGSIAGVAAVGGRAAAGDLFKQSGDSTTSRGGAAERDRDREPIIQGRPEPTPIIVQVRATHEPGIIFQTKVADAFAGDFRNNGVTRELTTQGAY